MNAHILTQLKKVLIYHLFAMPQNWHYSEFLITPLIFIM